MANNGNKAIAYITPEYLEVRPLGFNPELANGGGKTNKDDTPPTPAPIPFNPFDYLSELEKIIEQYLQKEFTIDNIDLKNKLKGIIRDIKELKSEIIATNGKIEAIVKNKDVAITTDNEALAQAIKQINAKFGEINASVDALKQAYASENSAISQKFEELKSTLPSADNIVNKITHNLDNRIEKTVDGKVRSITADVSKLSSFVGDHAVAIQNNAVIARQAKEYASKVKSIITDSNGRITGYQFSDGSDKVSKFEILADNFRIASSDVSYVPFQIRDRKIYFSGDVSFDQLKQTNTIIKIERFENNTPNQRMITASFNSKTNAAIALYNKNDLTAPMIAFIGRAGNGNINNQFLMNANSSAILLYLNQQELVER